MKYFFIMVPLLFALDGRATTLEIGAAFNGFTNRAAFVDAIGNHHNWGFEELQPQTEPTNVSSADGAVILTLALANPVPESFFPPVTTLAGEGIYFSFALPQPKGQFVFPAGLRAFGISLVWGTYAGTNPNGIEMDVYDKHDTLIGSVVIKKSQALAGPWSTTGGDTFEGFLGFITAKKAASVRFVPVDGSVWYDNAVWASTQPIPEPSTLILIAVGLLGIVIPVRRH